MVQLFQNEIAFAINQVEKLNSCHGTEIPIDIGLPAYAVLQKTAFRVTILGVAESVVNVKNADIRRIKSKIVTKISVIKR